MAEEFVPPSTLADTKDCSGNTSGFAKKTDTQYIAYSITGDSDYPGEKHVLATFMVMHRLMIYVLTRFDCKWDYQWNNHWQ